MNIRRTCRSVLLAVAASTPAAAQEPMYMEAATHPGARHTYSRLLAFSSAFRREGASVDRATVLSKSAYGLLPHLAVLFDAQAFHERADGRSTSGLSTVSLRLKTRFLRSDLSPLNTWRASVLAGLDVPGSDSTGAPDRVAPRLGVVTTAILGRHGLNGQVEWSARSHEPDRVSLHASYLFRLAPARYSPGTAGSWYAVVESLNEISDVGDARSDAAVSALYEARRWAWEAGVRLPVGNSGWPERLTIEFGTGARVLF